MIGFRLLDGGGGGVGIVESKAVFKSAKHSRQLGLNAAIICMAQLSLQNDFWWYQMVLDE